MSKVWITSDCHFHHPNLVRGISTWDKGWRDFDKQEEHDETIIKNINDMVMEDDLLIQLGDFAFGDKAKNVPYFRSRLNVKRILSGLGNHDKRSVIEDVFGKENTFDYLEYKHGKNYVILCHYPIHSWNGMKYTYHCSGHLHSNPARIHGRSMDVGLDGNNLKPYLLDDVIEFLKKQPIYSEGHH